MCRRNATAKFECRRPCCISAQTIDKSSTSNVITATAAAAAAADVAGDDDAEYSADVKHHTCDQHRQRSRGVVSSQPVGPVRCRSTPGLSFHSLTNHDNKVLVSRRLEDGK